MRTRLENMPYLSCTVCLTALTLFLFTIPASAIDVSPKPFLQWFDGSFSTIERRTGDIFAAGYGSVWLPPPGRADSGNFSVGYDVYDRFDLGSPRNPTLYGTETGLKSLANHFHRAGIMLHIDAVVNHNGFSDLNTFGFTQSGGYPGFLLQDPDGGSDPFGIPGTDGDFHSPFDSGDIKGRLAGLIDINHSKNFRFIRHPVPGFNPSPGDHGGNLPAGTTPDPAGRLANTPLESNRRFYPDRNLDPIMVFDPSTGEQNIAVYPYNLQNPTAGDPVGENATGYLMRYLQWMVQEVGVDGYRIDAAKHIEQFAFNFFDRAVYRANPRKNLDGSTNHVFSYLEVFDGSKSFQQSFIRKDINPNDPGRIGGNRDVLDFPLNFALRDNLTGNGFQNDWRDVVIASMDFHDDGQLNGSQGVMFAQSHDESAPNLGNVANAYVLMHPGNAVVYFNGKEFGDNRDFPKDGRGDALGGVFGNTIQKLVQVRNTHGRGNYRQRWLDKELYAFERSGSALVLLSNRLDSGFDSRTLDVDFPFGTWLVELTGNADDPNIDPFDDIPSAIQVFDDCFGCQTRVNVRFPRNTAADNDFHGKGYLVYGLPTPSAPDGIQLTNVDSILDDPSPDPNGFSNGTTKLKSWRVIKSDTFDISLQTQPVFILGQFRDQQADGDNALLKIDGGIDLNNNGSVDFTTPGSATYGFETFQTKHSDLWTGGDGEFRQTIDATKLSEGQHFVEVIAFRHRDDGGPAVYSRFTRVLYIDRLPPDSEPHSFEPFDPAQPQNRDLIIQSNDQTADNIHVFLNLPAAVTNQQILDMASAGDGLTDQIDRDLFVFGFFNLPEGNHTATIVTFEPTGTSNVQRYTGISITNALGLGLADINADNNLTPSHLAGRPNAFEDLLYSQNQKFHPAADINADGLIDNRDLFLLKDVLDNQNASPTVLAEYRALLLRRADLNQNGQTDASDINTLAQNFGSTDWLFDLNTDGVADFADVQTFLHQIIGTHFGDINLDGVVDGFDWIIWQANFGQASNPGYTSGDFNLDGIINNTDYQIWLANFGAVGPPPPNASLQNQPLSSIPETSTLLFLLLLIPGATRRS